MTYCPNCGSGNIYLKRQTTFVYGAVGNRNSFVAAGGTDENYQNACMNCGHTWDAKELFNTLKLASGIVEQEIDLRYPKHRLFIQELSQELSSYLYSEGKLQDEMNGKMKASKLKRPDAGVCIMVPIIVGFATGAFTSSILGWTVGITLAIIISIIDSRNENNKRVIEREAEEKIREEWLRKKEKLRHDFGQNLHRIGTKHGLIRYELPPHPTQTLHNDWINKDFGI
jgi:hypothetical protein